MKKIVCFVLCLAMFTLLLASCGPDKPEELTKIKIGVMSGPTGMGMAKLMNDNKDNTEKYEFSVYSAPTNATADLANGTLDMLCLPTNTAAALANSKSDYISTIAINTLGSLYLLTDADTTISSIADLEGKTIYASVPSSTTGPIINYLLEKNNVNATVEFEADHDALVAKLAANQASIAILPEPKVTAALIQNSAYSVDLDLSEEWSKVSDEPLTMGCIVVKNEFLAQNKASVDAFLAEYELSINYIANPDNLDSAAQMIVDAGVLPKLPVAKKALANLGDSITYIDGVDMKNALKAFYSSIGLASVADEFYYEKEN